MGESPKQVITRLEDYLSRRSNEQVWENSWVRFPKRTLSSFALDVFNHDLLADKTNSSGPLRQDVKSFFLTQGGEPWIRIPISYLVKLALADVAAATSDNTPSLRRIARDLMPHFANDNSSPETCSFYITAVSPTSGMGRAIARETAKRFLLTQLLVMYANQRFQLKDTGQRAVIYAAPHPPIRQKELNGIIPDSLYRELFVNPCLSGWDRGEEKFGYMMLCHQVLSRAQLNALGKLKDAGIITRNLVVLPTGSNLSLANNGTHISLGSRKLTGLLRANTTAFDAASEKYLGDLTIKVVEHFLPLFVGSYSAAPYRLDFWDFHPELVLACLSHELDFTHLRMIWRRWKKKAGLNIFGQSLTPVGPIWLDKAISFLFRLRGDFIPDYRLIDYLMSLLSTEESQALDGTLGNDDRLKSDLSQLGVFDERMSLYLLYKLRSFHRMGFSGFEGRYYSLFESLLDDMSEAAGLQALVTALAYKYAAQGEVTHAHIPDDPFTESERRQVLFAAAVNTPTFFIRKQTPNLFLAKILGNMKSLRLSGRYPGYVRAYVREYRRALVNVIRKDAADLIEAFRLHEVIDNLEHRLEDPGGSAFDKLTRGILKEAGASSPMAVLGDELNGAAESYYRDTLRKKHVLEGLEVLQEDLRAMDSSLTCLHSVYQDIAKATGGAHSPSQFVGSMQQQILDDEIELNSLQKIIHLTLMVLHRDVTAHPNP